VRTRGWFSDIAVVAERAARDRNVSERIRMHVEALNHALANIRTEDLADQDICIVLNRGGGKTT